MSIICKACGMLTEPMGMYCEFCGKHPLLKDKEAVLEAMKTASGNVVNQLNEIILHY